MADAGNTALNVLDAIRDWLRGAGDWIIDNQTDLLYGVIGAVGVALIVWGVGFMIWDTYRTYNRK